MTSIRTSFNVYLLASRHFSVYQLLLQIESMINPTVQWKPYAHKRNQWFQEKNLRVQNTVPVMQIAKVGSDWELYYKGEK